jgi:methylated-DNA-[protein]-cysteine S-methyltransferase
MSAIATSSAVCYLSFGSSVKFDTVPEQSSAVLHQLETELDEYFSGKRRHFTVPLDLGGTPFQQRVWDALQNIEYGTTISYIELARRIGNPKAMRAVAQANGRNPVPILVPCHRVIYADGSLGGYSSGLPFKVKLLDHERASKYNV